MYLINSLSNHSIGGLSKIELEIRATSESHAALDVDAARARKEVLIKLTLRSD